MHPSRQDLYRQHHSSSVARALSSTSHKVFSNQDDFSSQRNNTSSNYADPRDIYVRRQVFRHSTLDPSFENSFQHVQKPPFSSGPRPSSSHLHLHEDSTPLRARVNLVPQPHEDRSLGDSRPVHQPRRSQGLGEFEGLYALQSGIFEREGLRGHDQRLSLSPSASGFDLDRISGQEADFKPISVGGLVTNSSVFSQRPVQTLKPPIATTGTAKSSRYLREMDRRSILQRLASGEKQASLAKEFHVSRSTICNLYKQRQVIWARRDKNPWSFHPKKARPKAKASISPDPPNNCEKASIQALEKLNEHVEGSVFEVKSRALALLLTTIHNRETSSAYVKRCCSRAAHLLLEESLTILGDETSGAVTRPLYAISLERHADVLAETLHDLEPDCHSIDFWAPCGSHRSVNSLAAPFLLEPCNVMLLNTKTTSVDLVRTVIDALRDCGVEESRLSIVSLFISASVVAWVTHEHPLVKIFTASIDPVLHGAYKSSKMELESASTTFLERLRTLSE